VKALRVAPHVHSTWSYDGRWTLEALSRAFARRGYHAVLMAEHDRTFDAARWAEYRSACAQASAAGAVLVPGIEYSDAENRIHVPVWGAEEFLGRDRPTGDLLAAAAAQGAVSVIAHAGRKNAWQHLPDGWEELASGVEIWNRKYDGWAPGAAALELAARTGLSAFAGLDFHTSRQFFPLAMAGRSDGPVTAESVLGALKAGALSATVIRMPASRVAGGPALAAARVGESARRRLARTARRAMARR
jgi:hypothetical protein